VVVGFFGATVSVTSHIYGAYMMYFKLKNRTFTVQTSVPKGNTSQLRDKGEVSGFSTERFGAWREISANEGQHFASNCTKVTQPNHVPQSNSAIVWAFCRPWRFRELDRRRQ
jgi:hypothetical protein